MSEFSSPPSTGINSATQTQLDAKLPSASVLRSYLAADVTYNNVDTLAATDLSVSVAASGIYAIELVVHSASGVGTTLKMDFGGTATVTNFIGNWRPYNADGTGFDGLRVTSTGTDFANGDLDGANAFYTFQGTIEVNGAGTFLLRGAQNVADASNTTLLRGSTLTLTKLN
jgi:hypothetical protein